MNANVNYYYYMKNIKFYIYPVSTDEISFADKVTLIFEGY